MSLRLLRLVAVVKDEIAVGDQEEDEAAGHESRDPMSIPAGLERLREQLEQRNCDDDSAGERDRRLQAAAKAKCDAAAHEGRDDGEARERYRDPGHAQSAQVP